MPGRTRKTFRVAMGDGNIFEGDIHQIYRMVKSRDPARSLREVLIHERVYFFSRLGPIPLEKLLAETHCLRTEKASEWARQRAQRFEGVEGLDGPASALDVWEALVASVGKTYPGKRTILGRLQDGIRDRETLLHGHKKKDRVLPLQVFPTAAPPPKVVEPEQPVVKFMTVVPIWQAGGKPYFRPRSLDGWPVLKDALLGGN